VEVVLAVVVAMIYAAAASLNTILPPTESIVMSCRGLLVAFVLVSSAGPLRAGPLDSKGLAKAEFEASQATPAQLKQERQAVSNRGRQAVWELFQQGVQQQTYDVYLEWVLMAAEDEAALAEGKPDAELRLRLIGWQAARVLERINDTKLTAGVTRKADAETSRADRLTAEIALLRARASHPAPDLLGAVPPSQIDPLHSPDETWAALNEADLKALVRSRHESAAAAALLFQELYRHGVHTITLHTVMAAVSRLLEAESSLAGGANADSLGHALRSARVLQQTESNKLTAGVTRYADEKTLEAYCLKLEMELARAEPVRKPTELRDGFWSRYHPLERGAAAHREPPDGDVNRLAARRVAAAREACEARLELFRKGVQQVTLDVTLASSDEWLAADLAAARTPADRRAARERHWQRCLFLEEVVGGMLIAGVNHQVKLALARRARLTAQIDLAENK
jgi:hypothetical protein